MDKRLAGLQPRRDLIAAAAELAARTHDGQTDKLGKPYMEHVFAVANIVLSSDDYHKLDTQDRQIAHAAALLHDTLEDSDLDPIEMIQAGFPEALVTTVITLTHMPHEPRTEYYARIRTNPIAITVKLADIAHNSNPDRINQIPDPETRERLTAKYTAAENAIGHSSPMARPRGTHRNATTSRPAPHFEQ